MTPSSLRLAPAPDDEATEPAPVTLSDDVPTPAPTTRRVPAARRVLTIAVVLGALLAALALDLYGLEPLFQQHAQRGLLHDLRHDLEAAANGSSGLSGEADHPAVPPIGTAVALLEVPGLGLRQVVVEGADPTSTTNGPGHVRGTAGLGQPGDAVVVGRRAMFGGPFGSIGRLREGDEILVTTTQGQSVYEVDGVRRGTPAPATGRGDHLTLLTAASRSPLDGDAATTVVASLRGKPFPATPQGRRRASESSGAGDAGAWPWVIVLLAIVALAAAGAVWLHRRLPLRLAHLLTTVPLVVLLVVLAETASRVLPSWA